jgi:hypothetical protein
VSPLVHPYFKDAREICEKINHEEHEGHEEIIQKKNKPIELDIHLRFWTVVIYPSPQRFA